jgi:hypothetical protein
LTILVSHGVAQTEWECVKEILLLHGGKNFQKSSDIESDDVLDVVIVYSDNKISLVKDVRKTLGGFKAGDTLIVVKMKGGCFIKKHSNYGRNLTSTASSIFTFAPAGIAPNSLFHCHAFDIATAKSCPLLRPLGDQKFFQECIGS